MNDEAQNPELESLLSHLFDGTLSAADRARLDNLLAADDAARQTYLDFVEVHTFLRKQLALPDRQRQLEPQRTDLPEHARPSYVQFFSRPTALSMTVAAMVVGLLVTAMAFMAAPVYRRWAAPAPPSLSEGAPVIVATLSGLSDPLWAEGQIGRHQGAQLVAGREMNLKSGLAEITFRKGARVVLQGPAKLVLHSDNAARLASGKLVARVPSSAVGFAVETPAAVITDLGTEFGVAVQDEQIEAHVFVGEVLVQAVSRGGNPSGPVRIGAGEAVRIEADGQVQPALPAEESRFPRRTGFVNLARGKPIVDESASWPGPPKGPDFRYVAEHVVDGKVDDAIGSYWIGRYEVAGELFTLDLGSSYRLERIELLQTHNGVANNFGTNEFELWASEKIDDARQLVEPRLIASGNLPNAAGVGAKLPVYVLSVADGGLKPHEARYVRFVAKTYHGVGCGLNEIRVYGERHSENEGSNSNSTTTR